MSKQAQVGIFTVVGIAALFAIFFVLANVGLRADSYKIGVRFGNAAGLRPGAVVYLSGVPVGTVDGISLLDNYHAEVVMAIKSTYDIPTDARFLIQAPLTGEPTLVIVPRRGTPSGGPTLPHEVLAIDQQPVGDNPVSVADLLEQGQGEIKRVDSMLTLLQTREPALLAQLSTTLANANELTANANRSLASVSARVESLADAVQQNLTTASANAADLTGSLDDVVKRNSRVVDSLLAQLQTTSKSFSETVDSIHSIATDPTVKANLLQTSHDFAQTAHTLAAVTGDLRKVTANQETQAQLRDTIAQVDATTQKVDSLLGQIGGTSSVYGVDKGATPPPAGAAGATTTSGAQGAPAATASPAAGASSAPGGGSTAPSTRAPNSAGLVSLRERINGFTKDLVELQVRVSELAPLRPGSADRNTSPLLTADRGPQSDFNLFVLPHANTGLEAGVNDIGSNGTSTANFLLVNRASHFTYATGILYSRLGVDASIAGRALGFEARAYDLRHPTLDTYVNLYALRKLQIFAGERDLTHASRRSTIGVQAEF